MPLMFERVVLPDDAAAIVDFLCSSEWPFHGTRRPSASEAAAVPIDGPDIASFWIFDAGIRVGLIRLLDLDDVEDGSPLFDVRVASDHRSRGVGSAAVEWLTNHLLSTFESLHRIEATTRIDNVAMRHVLDRCGYRLEGALRDAWRSADGSRCDTAVYGLLRSEWPTH